MTDSTCASLQVPVNRQAVIAELGQQALETDDIDQLMYDATVTVAETLDADYCKVLELMDDGDELLLRQGVGWDDGIVGSATAPTERGSQAGYTLLSEEPIIVDDLRTEDRFIGPELLTSHDVVSGISVIIGSVDDPWGVLGVHTTEKREFTEVDAIFVKNVSNTLAAAIEAERTQAQLERTLDLFEKTERTANVGGWEIDPNTMKISGTDHFSNLLGIPNRDEMTVTEVLEMYHEDDRPIIADAIEMAIETGEPFDVEVRFHTPDNGLRWLHMQGVPEMANGEVATLRGAAQDVTKHKEYKRELEASHERLEEFASAVSHELKKPLGTVTSYLQLLDRRYEDELDEEAEEFIDFAVGSATRMRETIDGIVSEYGRVDSFDETLDTVDLNVVLEDVLTDLDTTIERSDAAITTDCLPRVAGEASQLHQLLSNLLDNAIKYSGEDPPRIHVSAACDGDMWSVSVRDEGIGIEPDATDAVFDVFHQLHDDSEYSGVGIGLSLCRRIVRRHGGEIWIDSEPGEGTTFTFTVSPAEPFEEQDRSDAASPS